MFVETEKQITSIQHWPKRYAVHRSSPFLLLSNLVHSIGVTGGVKANFVGESEFVRPSERNGAYVKIVVGSGYTTKRRPGVYAGHPYWTDIIMPAGSFFRRWYSPWKFELYRQALWIKVAVPKHFTDVCQVCVINKRLQQSFLKSAKSFSLKIGLCFGKTLHLGGCWPESDCHWSFDLVHGFTL